MLIDTERATLAAAANVKPINPFLGKTAAGGVVDVAVDASPNVAVYFSSATGDVGFNIGPPFTGVTWDGLVARALVQWADTVQPMPSIGVVPAGSYWLYDEEAVYVIQAHDRGVFGGDPFQYPALNRLYRNPWRRYPWHQPTDQYDSFLLVNLVTGLPDETDHAGQSWRTRRNTNTWEPGTSDSGWMRISNLPAPWIHVGNEGYPLNWQVTHVGRLWRNDSANNFWPPDQFGWTDIGPAP